MIEHARPSVAGTISWSPESPASSPKVVGMCRGIDRLDLERYPLIDDNSAIKHLGSFGDVEPHSLRHIVQRKPDFNFNNRQF
ncbi:MAG: hypothetical protein WB760_07015 [Xanthobacteraceae bacterium]